MEEINVKVVRGIDGSDCDIEVPTDATVGDVIVGLVNEGFLNADNSSARNVLYNKDANGGISSDGKYYDRSKTVKEYGWQNGQTLIAIYESVAKPVIYLYPNKEMTVNVKLKNSDLITVSYPHYAEGWTIIAHPNGTLNDVAKRNEYSYLFWEANGRKHYDIKSGYLVHREELIEFLISKLSSFGLTPREYNEFIVYWYPILMANEYNAINFFCEEYEEDFKLDITPKPDEILRIFMVYKKAEKGTTLETPVEPDHIKRDGFTVIEWGGQLIK